MTKKHQPSYGQTVGMPIQRPNRNEATPNVAPAPQASAPGQGDRQTEIFTLFTQVGLVQPTGTPVLYNADRYWANVTVTLETAGPVAVGTRADLFPVLSGKGVLLTTDVPMTFTLGKGQSRLYYAATAVSRVKVIIEPFAWMEQVTTNVELAVQLLQHIARK